MAWAVEYTDEFEGWWETLSEEEQVEITAFWRSMVPYCPDHIQT